MSVAGLETAPMMDNALLPTDRTASALHTRTSTPVTVLDEISLITAVEEVGRGAVVDEQVVHKTAALSMERRL